MGFYSKSKKTYKRTDKFEGHGGDWGARRAARRAGKSSSLKGGGAAGFRGFRMGKIKGR